MKVKVRAGAADTWIDALPESLKHEFSSEELEQMKQQVRHSSCLLKAHGICLG
jgi:hypothetical protein